MKAEENITWKLAFLIWWKFAWRVVVFGLSGAVLIGTACGLLGYFGFNLKQVVTIALNLGGLFVVVLQIWVIRTILMRSNRVGKYSLVLAESERRAD